MSQSFAGTGLTVSTLDISYRDGPALDAFNRLRVSQPRTRLHGKFLADIKSGLWDTKTSNVAPTFSTGGYVTLSAPNNNDYVVRQTYIRADYEPGKSQRMVATGVLDPVANYQKRIGWAVANTSAPYKPYEGVYFLADDDGAMKIVECLGGSEIKVTQASWNIDTADGNGISEITVDWTKGQIFWIDLQWLALGRIRYGIEIGGVPIPVHETTHANLLTAPYMAIPNLPLYYSIHAGAAGTGGSMRQICCVVESEGGKDDAGRPFSFSTRSELTGGAPAGSPVSITDSNLHALVAIRLRSGRTHAMVSPINISVLCESTAAFRWALLRNPTIAGAALSYAQVSDAVEGAKAVAANTCVVPFTTNANQRVLDEGFVGSQQSSLGVNLQDFRIGAAIDGTSDIIVLAAERIGSSSPESFYGSISWLELE
jgi:hypothetical protein